MKMYQVIIYVPFLLITKTTSHVPKNGSDVVIYGGHADAQDYLQNIPKKKEKETTTKYINVKESIATTTEKVHEVDDGFVVFVPTQSYVRHENEDIVHGDTMKLEELMSDRRRLNDLMTEKPLPTPHSDIVFVHGKNEEKTHEEKVEAKKTHIRHEEARIKTEEPPTEALDCKHLNCNQSIQSVCGAKIENGHLRYRLFMNECYYRKVNCAFSYDTNRYKMVPIEKCDRIGSHNTQPPQMFMYQPLPMQAYPQVHSKKIVEESREVRAKKPSKLAETRRRFSGRKAMMIGIDGSYCSHQCPTTCTDHYEPECAISINLERRVFLNHCKLDYNSCAYGIVWRRRPLSECVGGRKADMQQNKAFIGWMQRVGIVDKKGRLVLS